MLCPINPPCEQSERKQNQKHLHYLEVKIQSYYMWKWASAPACLVLWAQLSEVLNPMGMCSRALDRTQLSDLWENTSGDRKDFYIFGPGKRTKVAVKRK